MVGPRELESLTSCVSIIRVNCSTLLTLDRWCSKYRAMSPRLIRPEYH